MNGTPFWQEVNAVWLPQNSNWRTIITQMPDRINALEIVSRVQSSEQLVDACTVGIGYVNGKLVIQQPDKLIMQQYLVLGLNPENLWFQYFYQFCIAEGICSTFSDNPLAEWPPSFLCLLEEIFHFLVYVSALLYLVDASTEKRLLNPDGGDWFLAPEPEVKKCIKSLIDTMCGKEADYGQSYRRHGLPGLIPRIWDKMARYLHLKSVCVYNNYEPRVDSACDLLGYSLIGWSLLLELENEKLGEPSPGEVFFPAT